MADTIAVRGMVRMMVSEAASAGGGITGFNRGGGSGTGVECDLIASLRWFPGSLPVVLLLVRLLFEKCPWGCQQLNMAHARYEPHSWVSPDRIMSGATPVEGGCLMLAML